MTTKSRPYFFASACVFLLACSLLTPANVKTALDATALGCVFASEIIDAKAVADACAIDQALVPVLEKLIAQREAAKKSGVEWAAK